MARMPKGFKAIAQVFGFKDRKTPSSLECRKFDSGRSNIPVCTMGLGIAQSRTTRLSQPQRSQESGSSNFTPTRRCKADVKLGDHKRPFQGQGFQRFSSHWFDIIDCLQMLCYSAGKTGIPARSGQKKCKAENQPLMELRGRSPYP
jgi:hypothetical protein